MTDKSRHGENNGPSDEEIMQAVPGRESGREVRLGAFVLVGLLAFVAILFLLTDPALFRGRYKIVTRVEDAGGIRAGDPVQMRGVNIGRISEFGMTPDGAVDIVMEVEGEWDIPVDSRTAMGGAGLFGGRTLQVIRGEADTYLEAGDRIPGEGASSDPMAAFNDLGEQAGDVMARLETLLDEGTVSSVQGSTRELEALLRELNTVIGEQRAGLRRITASLERSAAGLEAASAAGPDAARVVARADSTMLTLAATSRTLDEAATSLASILQRMEDGEGTLGLLSRDEELYRNLNTAAERMATLVADIQENPGRYINLSIF